MEQQYRSRLNSLPVELKEEIASYVLQWGMTATNRRLGILDAFKRHNVQVDELGTGTNRLIVKYQGYALKIALDDEGIDDNRQEWVMSERLYPYVARAYEISGDIIKKDDGTCEIIGGHLLVADYAPAFSSWGEMIIYQPKIRKILEMWSHSYLLGDVGITKKNFANWGLLHGKPVCIDYAYIFPGEMKLFQCICGNDNLDINRSDFSSYTCTNPDCRKKFTDSELRARIPNSKRHALFSAVEGVSMSEEFETHDVDPKYIKQNNVHIKAPIDVDPMEIAKIVCHAVGYYDNGTLGI